jgi:hypothetical protein
VRAVFGYPVPATGCLISYVAIDHRNWPWPAAVEDIVLKAWYAAETLYPARTLELRIAGWRLWVAEDPWHYIMLRDGPARWGDWPELFGIPATDGPFTGWGGCRLYPEQTFDGLEAIVIASYKPSRATERLLIHELTHLLTGIDNHSDAFQAAEAQLWAEYERARQL